MKIVSRYNPECVLYEYADEHATTRETVEAAVATGAILSGADLSGADLSKARIAAGTISGVLACGCLLDYWWVAYQMEAGSVRLLYGCEEHDLREWPGLLRGLCEQHESGRADEYERHIRVLLSYVEALAGAGEGES